MCGKLLSIIRDFIIIFLKSRIFSENIEKLWLQDAYVCIKLNAFRLISFNQLKWDFIRHMLKNHCQEIYTPTF